MERGETYLHKLSAFENKVLRRTFGSKRHEEGGESRKPRNE
jgi:hypothetical protein